MQYRLSLYSGFSEFSFASDTELSDALLVVKNGAGIGNVHLVVPA